MKLSALFTTLNQLKIDHWHTKSHAEHKALQKAYEALDGLFDRFVEALYGRDGIPADSNTQYTIKNESYKEGALLGQYTSLRKGVVDMLTGVAGSDGDLKNLVDEIEAEFNILLYKLQQK